MTGRLPKAGVKAGFGMPVSKVGFQVTVWGSDRCMEPADAGVGWGRLCKSRIGGCLAAARVDEGAARPHCGLAERIIPAANLTF